MERCTNVQRWDGTEPVQEDGQMTVVELAWTAGGRMRTGSGGSRGGGGRAAGGGLALALAGLAQGRQSLLSSPHEHLPTTHRTANRPHRSPARQLSEPLLPRSFRAPAPVRHSDPLDCHEPELARLWLISTSTNSSRDTARAYSAQQHSQQSLATSRYLLFSPRWARQARLREWSRPLSFGCSSGLAPISSRPVGHTNKTRPRATRSISQAGIAPHATIVCNSPAALNAG